MKQIAVMLASGKGTRLYPISTKEKPKQFLPLLSDKTMLRETIDRVSCLYRPQDVFVMSTDNYMEMVDNETHNALFEPYGIGQTTSVLYLTIELTKMFGDCKITIFPTDHYVGNPVNFQHALKQANNSVEDISLIGVHPAYAETEYGYMSHNNGRLKEFIQKPNENVASMLVNDGYLWNTGIISYRSEALMHAYQKIMPDFYDLFSYAHHHGFIDNLYQNVNLPEGNLEGDILQHMKDIHVVEGHFPWSDVGNMDRLKELELGW